VLHAVVLQQKPIPLYREWECLARGGGKGGVENVIHQNDAPIIPWLVAFWGFTGKGFFCLFAGVKKFQKIGS
jgi:hypothetical protein